MFAQIIISFLTALLMICITIIINDFSGNLSPNFPTLKMLNSGTMRGTRSMPEKPTRRRILIGPFDETASLPILGGGVLRNDKHKLLYCPISDCGKLYNGFALQ